MTPEEKAKRYNELAKEVKGFFEGKQKMHSDITQTLEYLFPELKESEDEKIRKWCISHFKACINVIKDNDEYKEYLNNKVISWLEKQGRHANFRNKIQIGDKVTRNEDGVLVNLSQLKRVAKKGEKQGEQKQDPCEHCEDVMLNCHNFPCIKKRAFKQGKSAFEAINEEKVDNVNKVEPKDYSSIDPHFGKPIDKVETKDYNNIDPHFDKPADKVEPKFHEGQWIVWQGKNFKVNYNGCGYELTDQNGKSTSLEYGAIDKSASAFTIQDAKDGDVLQLGKVTAIFQDYISDKECRCYCSVFEGEFKIPIQYADTYGCHNVIPANKEQRDTLMKAMADAGYTFDFEKKELKKIEDEIEIPFGAKDSELQEAIYYIPKGFHAEIDGDKVVIKKGEKPTAWSEMDKAMTRLITSDLELLKNRGYGEHGKAAYRSEIKWLKSLRYKVGCGVNYTTTKEWGEEDKTALGDALWCCKQAASIAKNENDMGNIWYAEKWLKSLEGRIQPKNDYNPYKEVIESISKMCERYDKYSHSDLKDFYDNVKVKCKDAKEFDSLH